MKNFTKDEAIKIITESAIAYDEKLNDKHFLILYVEKSRYKYCAVGFRQQNFLHFTGVKTRLSSALFYDACINKKISPGDINISRDGNMSRKLSVLPYLPGLLYNTCMIGSFVNSGILIKADYFVGDSRAVISVGFRSNKVSGSPDFPVTLFADDIRMLTNPTDKVIAIFYKNWNEHIYRKCSFLSKGQSLDKIYIPDEIKGEIDLTC